MNTQKLKFLYTNEMLVLRGHYYKTFGQAIQSIIFTLNDATYKKDLNRSDKNWVGKPTEVIIKDIQCFLMSLGK